MDQLTALKQVLLTSIQRNGNQPLTLQHLVNLIGIVERSDLLLFDLKQQVDREFWEEENANGVNQ